MKRASWSLRFMSLTRPCWGMWSRFIDQHLAGVDPAGQCLHLDSLAHAGQHWDVASHGRCGNCGKRMTRARLWQVVNIKCHSAMKSRSSIARRSFASFTRMDSGLGGCRDL